MNKKKFFYLIVMAVITATIMLSYSKTSEFQITDTLFKNNGNTMYVTLFDNNKEIRI